MTDNLFFDTDCISAFLWTEDTDILSGLYGGRIVLPEPVYLELSNPSVPHIKQRIDKMICSEDAAVKIIDAGTAEYRLYISLVRDTKEQKRIGRGEAGEIALAKTYDGILASNNYKDIAYYIEKYNLKHTDTGHILAEAFKTKLITEAEGNSIWNKMLLKRRRLPARTFSDYLTEHTVKKQA